MTTLWLYLQFPALQLDSLFLQQQQTGFSDAINAPTSLPADRAAPPPLCLLDASTLLIIQLNRTASQTGVKAGMTLSMACALCHELQVLPYQTEQELHYLQQIAALLYQITADIALDPPNALWLRIEPMLVLYGGLNAYLAKLSQQLAPLQLTVNQAVAHTAAAAKLLCFSQPGFISSAPEQILAALNKCPLDHSQLSQSASGKKVLQQLQSMGLVNLGQVLAIPRTELGRRFSADLVALLDELIGQRPTVRQFYQPPEQFCQSLELLYQLEHSQQLQAPLAYLLQLLQNYLQLRDQHCYQLLLKLELRDHPPLQLSLQSACGEYLKSRWLALFQLKLQQLRLPAPLLKMQLSANQTTARNGDNLSLFDARARGAVARALDNPAESVPQQPAPLSLADALRLRSLLTAKLGAERVQQPISQADHRPELANGCREQTFNQSAVAGALDDRNTEPNKRAADILPLRPGLLLAEPIPLRMQLQLQPGLERIQTGWWDQHPVQRDYYIGRNAEGQWCWAFKNTSGWYLQGYFA